MNPSRDIARLIEIMAALRTPGTGCPWDLEQNFATIAPYTLEEAYEVADAIARGDLDDLRDELGDLLLQVVFHARMAQEQGAFDFGDVVQAITEKLIRRHPHVFGDARGMTPARSSRACGTASRPRKRREGEAQPATAPRRGRTARSPACRSALPALTRALKLQQKAGKVGFDWNDPMAVLAKIREEADEIEAELRAGERATAPPPRSAICCSPSSISRAISMPIRRPRCAPPTGNSSAASRRSSARWPRAARRPRSRRSPRWMRCGTRRRPRKAAARSRSVRACSRISAMRLTIHVPPRADIADRRNVRAPAAASSRTPGLAHEGDRRRHAPSCRSRPACGSTLALGLEEERKRQPRIGFRTSPWSPRWCARRSSRLAGSRMNLKAAASART